MVTPLPHNCVRHELDPESLDNTASSPTQNVPPDLSPWDSPDDQNDTSPELAEPHAEQEDQAIGTLSPDYDNCPPFPSDEDELLEGGGRLLCRNDYNGVDETNLFNINHKI